MARFICLVLIACGSPTPPKPTPTNEPIVAADAPAAPKLSAALAARWSHGCLLVGGLVETDHTRCSEPRRPYSTFKLANALIGLDAGVLADADAPMTWDKKAVPDEKRYLDSWRKPHTLRSAIAVSAVPHFRTLARTLGEQRMAAGLAKLHYGNQDMAGGLDKFWLSGGALRISAAEQLAFVDALAHGKLAVASKAQAVVREISELARTNDHVLHGKTGSGPLEDGRDGWLVWQVGWVERGSQIVPYAAWIEATGTIDDARAARDELLRASLAELGVYP